MYLKSFGSKLVASTFRSSMLNRMGNAVWNEMDFVYDLKDAVLESIEASVWSEAFTNYMYAVYVSTRNTVET